MSSTSKVLQLEALQESSAAWKLLRAKHAPVAIAVLDAHLGGTERRRPVPELVSLVEADLEELRFKHGYEFTRSAQAYCEQWRSDGYLVRRPLAQSRQETYELSADALRAIQFALVQTKQRSIATESRLSTIIDSINKLALEVDRDVSRRREVLLQERARIDEQLARLDAGDVPVLDDDRALEHARDIVSLAQEIPGDFLRVRAEFEEISQRLHASIINGEEGSDHILEEIFAGVDHIDSTPAGKSFRGFYSLLRDAELSEKVQDSIESILAHEFSFDLNPSERHFLRTLIRQFIDQSQETNAVRTSFSRGLQRFVQNQSYQQERMLLQEIDRALGAALKLDETHRRSRAPVLELELTSVQMRPLSRWRLANPAEDRSEPVALEVAEGGEPMTIEQLRAIMREVEIDFAELVANVNDAIAEARSRAAASARDARSAADGALRAPTVGDVLAAHPATQGVASVVGLMSLASQQGRPSKGDGQETVRWTSQAGVRRKATIALMEFYQEVS